MSKMTSTQKDHYSRSFSETVMKKYHENMTPLETMQVVLVDIPNFLERLYNEAYEQGGIDKEKEMLQKLN